MLEIENAFDAGIVQIIIEVRAKGKLVHMGAFSSNFKFLSNASMRYVLGHASLDRDVLTRDECLFFLELVEGRWF